MTSPVIGAALTNAELATYQNWILEKDRDLELQSFVGAAVLDDDWTPLADEVKHLLAGYKGRMGIHGPFWGFTIDTQDPLVRAVVQKRLGQGLDVCAAVGGTHMVVHSPFTTWDFNNLDGNTGARDKMFTRVHEVMAPIVKRAETLGVTLVLENIEDINLQDADGHADRHWQIGQGNILWPSVFAAIAALPVKPRLILELADKSTIPASMAYLQAQGLGQ